MSVWNSFGSGSWSVAANWIGGVPDAIGATADFSNLANASLTHHIDLAVLGPYTVGTLDLTSSTIEKYSLEHGALTMSKAGGAAINVTSTGSALASILAADLKLQMNAATLLTTTGSNTTLDILGMVTGVGELTKAGSGTLKLADAASNWDGGTSILAGRIDISAAALGTGAINFAGNSALRGTADLTLANDFLISSGASASIRAATGTTLTIAGSKFAAIGGVGTVLHFGSLADTGTVFFDPASAGVLVNNPGPISVGGGTLKAGLYLSPLLALSGGTSIASGATLDINAFNVTIEHLTGAGQVTNSGASNSTLTVHEAGTATFSGTILDGAHAVALSKTGAGTLTLSGVGKYTGGTHVVGGTLLAGIDNAVGTAGTIAIDAGATFDLGSSDQAVSGLIGTGGIRTEAVTSATLTVSVHGAEVYDFGGVISDGSALFGDLNLVKNGTGQQTLSGVNTYTGYTSLVDGKLALAAAGSIESSTFLTIFSGAVFDIGGLSGSVASVQSLASSGTVLSAARRSALPSNLPASAAAISSDRRGRTHCSCNWMQRQPISIFRRPRSTPGTIKPTRYSSPATDWRTRCTGRSTQTR